MQLLARERLHESIRSLALVKSSFEVARPSGSLAALANPFGVARPSGSLPFLSPCSHLLSHTQIASRVPRPASRVPRPAPRIPHPSPLSIAPRRQGDVLECEWLLVENWRLPVTRELPRRNVGEAVVVSQRFAVGRLMLDSEVRATGLLSIQRVDAHQLGELEKVGDATSALELLVQLRACAGHVQIAPELLAELRD